ncbi:MAG: hypothetical protein FRX49_11638 [Trebouxia sp. A1-2]|nr:MAG: hypothetical protein FRX49_11638 [Trebouxia sp. A1-2]
MPVSLPDQTDAHELYGVSAAQTVTPRTKTVMLAIGDEIELYRFLPDRASSTIMLKNPSRGVACGQLKKRRPGQKGLTASMQHEQSSHSMHAMLQAESRSQALIRFAQRMQAKGRAATNMSKARGKSGAALAQGQAALPQSQGRAITDLSHTITGMKMSHRSSSVNRSQAQVAGASLVQESVKECEPAQFSGELLLHSLVSTAMALRKRTAAAFPRSQKEQSTVSRAGMHHKGHVKKGLARQGCSKQGHAGEDAVPESPADWYEVAEEFERMLIPAGKGCAAYTAKGIAAQEATGLPVMTQDPSLLQLAEDAAGEELPGQVCQPEGHSRQVKGQGSCAERQAHDTEGQMCDLEGQTQAGSPSAPFPMLALDLVSSNAPAEGGSVVITDSQKAEALLDAQAQKAAAHLSAHIKQSPALARAQQQQPPVQVHAVCANAVSHNLQDAQICTAGGRATMTASHSAPASRQSGSHQKIEPLKYDHSGSIEGSSPARVLQELPSHQIPRHASIQQKQQKVLPKGQNSDALPCDKSVDSQQGRGRAAGHNGPGRGSCRGTDSVHDHDAVCAVVIETLAQQQQWRQRSAAVYHEARDAQHAMSFQSNTVPLASAAERPRQKLPMPWQPPGEQHCTAHLQKSDQIQQVVNLLTKGGSLC